MSTHSALLHPNAVLFAGSHALPVIPAVDHYCGSEKLMRKSLALQQDLGPVFDITLDCEDGAVAGREREHAELVAGMLAGDDNRFGRVGARIHDVTHPHWREDLRIILAGAGKRLAYLTLPKPRNVNDVAEVLQALRAEEAIHDIRQPIPLHALIETHGALRDVWQIAALPGVQSLDFGLMDFVSEHQGAIPASAIESPGQFEHPLVVRAKCEVAAAAHAYGLVPTHNVTTVLDSVSVPREDARRARQSLGYLRMWSIHPAQIEPILEGMRPAAGEVEAACAILVQAQRADWGPIRVGARLHDRGSFRHYWNLLLRARSTGMDIPEEASRRFFAAPGPTP